MLSGFSRDDQHFAHGSAIRPRIFVSYHHANDQSWYGLFTTNFSIAYDVFTDTSLERKVDSNDVDYARRVIREQNIKGSSVTIVLCGAETWKRRWVDWEIQMTLNKQHALIGINLPTCAVNQFGQRIVPGRLVDNINSGYAVLCDWPQDVAMLHQSIGDAQARTRIPSNIINTRPTMKRSTS